LTGAAGLSTEVLFTPVYIKMGVIPSVAGVTSQFLSIFAAFSATIKFSILGYMHYTFGLWLGFIGILGTIFGSELVTEFISRSKRFSTMLWIISFMVFMSFTAEATVGMQEAIGKF